jgi:hypothetical protein
MSADISRFTRDPDLRNVIGRAFLALAGCSHEEVGDQFADTKAMLEATCFLTALLVEFDPDMRTPIPIRKRAENIGRQIAEFAEAIREHNVRSGAPLFGLRRFPG